MADIKKYLGMYSLHKALEADRPDGCFVLDVGHDQMGNAIKSYKHITKVLYEHLVHSDELPGPFTKLYIIGDWNTTCDEGTKAEGSGAMSQSTRKASKCFYFILSSRRKPASKMGTDCEKGQLHDRAGAGVARSSQQDREPNQADACAEGIDVSLHLSL